MKKLASSKMEKKERKIDWLPRKTARKCDQQSLPFLAFQVEQAPQFVIILSEKMSCAPT